MNLSRMAGELAKGACHCRSGLSFWAQRRIGAPAEILRCAQNDTSLERRKPSSPI